MVVEVVPEVQAAVAARALLLVLEVLRLVLSDQRAFQLALQLEQALEAVVDRQVQHPLAIQLHIRPQLRAHLPQRCMRLLLAMAMQAMQAMQQRMVMEQQQQQRRRCLRLKLSSTATGTLATAMGMAIPMLMQLTGLMGLMRPLRPLRVPLWVQGEGEAVQPGQAEEEEQEEGELALRVHQLKRRHRRMHRPCCRHSTLPPLPPLLMRLVWQVLLLAYPELHLGLGLERQLMGQVQVSV